MSRLLALGLGLAVAAVAVTGGCSGNGRAAGAVTVLAAASLTDAFTELGRVYEREHGVPLTMSFAGSQQVVAQVRSGAPAGVVATADRESMARLDSYVEQPTVFARTALTIAVAPGNPEDIGGLADLTREDLTVVLAAPEVPAGRYARQALSRADLDVRPASQEPNVRAVLSRVRLGEADAGIVYASDVEASDGAVEAVAIAGDVAATYRAAVVSSGDSGGPRGFVSWLTGERGQAVMARYGFTAP